MSKLDGLYSELTLPTQSKLVLLVLDGLGDLAMKSEGFLTPLEAADTPHLDDLTQESVQGRIYPVAPGITPGSGPGHMALFGYDPIEHQVGRGVIEALGLGLDLQPGDLAARANFCTLDSDKLVTDRRAGRIKTSECQRLCQKLTDEIKAIDDVEIIIQAGEGHRFVTIFRGADLEGPLSDADPHREGLAIPTAKPLDASSTNAQRAAAIVAKFIERALTVIQEEETANGLLLRGVTNKPDLPQFQARYGLRAACLAIYPMYKGLAQLVGMNKIEGLQSLNDQFESYLALRDDYDFFFIHHKSTDMHGEDGDFRKKKEAIEQVDEALPLLLNHRPDVLAVTGDHSTPCTLRGHSWHAQPLLLNSPHTGSDKLDRFNETSANLGSLGVFEAKFLMRLMQANAKMFDKFGA